MIEICESKEVNRISIRIIILPSRKFRELLKFNIRNQYFEFVSNLVSLFTRFVDITIFVSIFKGIIVLSLMILVSIP